MKINKRKCRAFADPGLRMQKGSGIICAKQIDYIVRTAVRIIDRHRTLVVYIYSRHQAVQGDFRPRWTVFQTKDDYMTLEQREDGSATWRNAAFEKLGTSWDFVHKCAFYSASDEERLCQYFKCTSGAGFGPLLNAQLVIQGKRRQERQRKRESKIIARMSNIQALPRGLRGWIHRDIMPAYFFYTYKRGGRDVPGTCSACGHEIQLSSVKQGRKATCPHCHKELTMKPRSRRGSCMADKETCQVIQDVGNGELVIRIIKVWYTYKSDIPEIRIYENARLFIHQDAEGKIHSEDYYYSPGSGLITDWKKGGRPVFSQWQYNFEADVCGHIYGKNLPAALRGTPWQYCPIETFYNHFREPMQAVPFLYAYLKHPRLEHLVKVGFCSIVSDMVYRYDYGQESRLDESKNRTHQVLQVAAEDVEFLRGLDVGLPTLKLYRRYQGVKDRQQLLLWHLEHKVERDVETLMGYMTAHKFMRYMDTQYELLCQSEPSRYKNMQDIVTEYRDYLSICSKLEYDLKNSFILFPKNLREAHDRAADQYKYKKDELMERDFIAVYQGITGKYDFEKYDMKIVYPDTPGDVIAEGHTLRHCVGRYVEDVAEGECIILFVRQCAAPDKPYYTVEVKGQKAVQVRGMKNCSMTPEVEAFISEWEERVLRIPLPSTVTAA